MTTAARPTWNAAKGGYTGRDLNFRTKIFHAKEIASHTKIKYRKRGQNSPAEMKERALKEKLIQAEQEFTNKKRKLLTESEVVRSTPSSPLAANSTEDPKPPSETLDASPPHVQDTDVVVSDDSSSELDDSEFDDDDSDDDTEALMRELDKIKRERAEERDRQEQERMAQEQRVRDAEIASGNPLLTLDSKVATGHQHDFTIKKRWDDDVVFKNQSRNDEKPVKRFINDTIRSDFHRKFLSKYIK